MMIDQDNATNRALVNNLRKQMPVSPSRRASVDGEGDPQLEHQAPGAVAPAMTSSRPDSSCLISVARCGAATAAGISTPRPAPMPPADNALPAGSKPAARRGGDPRAG